MDESYLNQNQQYRFRFSLMNVLRVIYPSFIALILLLLEYSINSVQQLYASYFEIFNSFAAIARSHFLNDCRGNDIML